MDVFWMPYEHAPNRDESWKQLSVIEPEPAFKWIAKTRTNEAVHLKCTGVQQYFRNTFVFFAPVDYRIKIDHAGRCTTMDYTREFFDSTITFRTEFNAKHRVLTLEFMFLVFSTKSVMVEMLPPYLDQSKVNRDLHVIPGTYDISKWVRPVCWGVEVQDGVDEIVIKRGDPMFMLRFNTEEKVNLVRTEQTPKVIRTVNACTGLPKFIPGESLDRRYKAAEFVMSKLLMDYKSCPFSRFAKFIKGIFK